MKLLIILLCTVTITTALLEKLDREVINNLLSGRTVTLNSIEAQSQVGALPDLYNNLTSDDRNASRNAWSFVEFARVFFPSGYTNIPPLDPYQPVLQSIAFLGPLASVNLELKGVRITGLQAFKLVDLTFRLNYSQRTREDAVVSLSSLKVKADFTLDLMLKNSIPLPTISGKFTAMLTDIKAKVAAGTSLDIPGGNSEERIKVDAVKAFVRAGKVKLKVHFDDDEIEYLLKDAVDDLLDQPYLEKLETKAGELLINLAMKEVNEMLAAYTAKHLKDFILM